MKVLLIEDDTACVMLFKYRFEKFRGNHPDLDIKSVPDLTEAFDAIRTFVPDIIVLDLNLKRSDYEKVIPEIPRFSAIAPVIVLSSMRDAVIKKRVKRAGALSFMNKGDFSSAEVISEVIRLYHLYNH